MKDKLFRNCSVLVFFFLFASCVGLKKGPPSAQVSTEKYENLEYLLLKPSLKHGLFKKYPLVILLHGSGQEADALINLWADEGFKNSVIIAAPRWMRISKDVSEGKDETGITSLADMLPSRYPIDKKRIFIAGISAGGLKAQHLIEENPSKWKGAILISYIPPLRWFRKAEITKTPSLLFTYGKKDSALNFEDFWQGESILREKRIPVSLLADPHAGHEYRSEWNNTIFEWINSSK